jgi:long-chain acyl-CoA synthetase
MRRENKDRAAIFDVHGRVTRTFAQIERRASSFERELDSFALGDVIAVQIGNHPDWPSLFLACLRTRVVVLPLEQTMAEEQRRAVFEMCGVVAVAIPTRSSRAEPRDPAEITFQLAPRHASASLAKRASSRAASLLKLTSGTTAGSRAICFRSEQLLADCENICDTMGISAQDVNFGVIPISHSYGFSNLLTPLLARGVALVLSGDRMPRAIFNGIAATGATVFPGMPVFYQSLSELHDAPSLPRLRLCISAGAPLTVEVARGFEEKFGLPIHSFYGSSECGGICYTRTPQPMPGFVGEPMRGVKVDLLHGDDESSDENFGAIEVRSAAVGEGYFPEPDETKLGGGVFRPDDLLEKTANGFRIVGRISDLINVAGKKVSPIQVETEILQCAGVRDAVVFGRDSARRNQEVAACVVAHGVSEAQLLAHCRARLSSWQVPRRIFLVDRMPVNERGKISRRELARKYRDVL